MAERIYNLTGDGAESALYPFEEEPFDEEDALQELIARNPELLAGEQMNPSDPPRFILISREVGIADQADGAARWSLDHALIDQHAVPTLVETKRGDNRELRRTIVGQMMDYAAHASKYWTTAELRKQFEEHEDADQRLAELLDDDDPDQEDFWRLVETNLTARILRLLFVADRIPDELATVVEFLNEQMPRIEVLAVEVRQFRSDSGRILVPRVIGRLAAATGRGAQPRSKLTRESFLRSLGSTEAERAARELLQIASDHGAVLSWGTSAVTIRKRCRLWPSSQPLTVGWLCAESGQPGWNNIQDFTFGYASGHYDLPPDSPLTHRLEAWAGAFENDSFSKQLHNRDLDAWWVAHGDAPAHIETLKGRLAAVLDDLGNL